MLLVCTSKSSAGNDIYALLRQHMSLKMALELIQFTNSKHVKGSNAFFLPAPVHTLRIAAYIVYCLVEAASVNQSGSDFPAHMRLDEAKHRGLATLNECIAGLPRDLQVPVRDCMCSIAKCVGSHLPSYPGNSIVPASQRKKVEEIAVEGEPVKQEMCKAERETCHQAMVCLWSILACAKVCLICNCREWSD